MLITQKKMYALRAVFELAKQMGKGPIKASQIAETQAIPVRFLEVILNELKRNGIVDSKRGFYGGYQLAIEPESITVGQLFRVLDGTELPAECVACVSQKKNCPLKGNCVFKNLWNQVQCAIYDIVDQTSIRHLMEKENNHLISSTVPM